MGDGGSLSIYTEASKRSGLISVKNSCFPRFLRDTLDGAIHWVPNKPIETGYRTLLFTPMNCVQRTLLIINLPSTRF
jgi:hypothetical protein